MSSSSSDDMCAAYSLDYSKSKPNGFAAPDNPSVVLDADVAAYLRARAAAKGIRLDALVNDTLYREIALIEAVDRW